MRGVFFNALIIHDNFKKKDFFRTWHDSCYTQVTFRLLLLPNPALRDGDPQRRIRVFCLHRLLLRTAFHYSPNFSSGIFSFLAFVTIW